MSRLIIISNRLPVNITRGEGKLHVRQSVGGLATGLSSVGKRREMIWIGWPGIHKEQLSRNDQHEISEILGGLNCHPVFLTEQQVREYYEGFSNKTIWPLFHYFAQYTQYEMRYWQVYQEVNELFCRQVAKIIEPGDTVWIHDYQLMLLPGMLRQRFNDVTIGFFLHIPFPSFEIFRLLPWRKEILEGMLGADLIGFHTYDYVRHFFSSIRRICGLEHIMGQIHVDQRLVKVDMFPMGIDYQKYSRAVDRKKVKDAVAQLRKKIGKRKVILSVDRLDYSKGILQRLEAYDWYLTTHPEMRGKVVMILLAVPSRTGVEHYDELRNNLEQLVGRINGSLGMIGWIPVWYLFRAVPFERLIALYHLAEIGLITPLRDGMNLIAKEFIATKTQGKGVLVLSEMAGAASELPEAIAVNANDKQSIVDSIDQAMNMPVAEQRRRMRMMQDRLSRYTVTRWVHDFLESLKNVKQQQELMGGHTFSGTERKTLLESYKQAPRRLLLLDYDGTLVGFAARPEDAGPDQELMDLLTKLADDPKNEVVVISGRDRQTLDRWLKKTKVSLIAEHGAWKKMPNGRWKALASRRQEWKTQVLPILEVFTERTPGSAIEEKTFSLVWHFRRTAPELAMIRSQELKDALTKFVSNMDLGVFEGNKILEIKLAGMHKGHAASQWLRQELWDFVMAAGDDYTDEDLFDSMPSDAFSIKIGRGPSKARYSINSVEKFRELLKQIARCSNAET